MGKAVDYYDDFFVFIVRIYRDGIILEFKHK
jgi:hypothetical protein